jgi:hypothetical protein
MDRIRSKLLDDRLTGIISPASINVLTVLTAYPQTVLDGSSPIILLYSFGFIFLFYNNFSVSIPTRTCAYPHS